MIPNYANRGKPGIPSSTRSQPGWQVNALCGGMDVAIFYGRDDGPKRKQELVEREAKKVCLSGCPVREECLTWALEFPERFGTWGGLTSKERKDLRRRQADRLRRRHG